jgi:enoyl-CoA hydratase/carnithine racemase
MSLQDANAVQFNRPKALNSFGGNLIPDTIAALRVLNEHPDTVFTVLTGEGRFFSAGADVRNVSQASDVRIHLMSKRSICVMRLSSQSTDNRGQKCWRKETQIHARLRLW